MIIKKEQSWAGAAFLLPMKTEHEISFEYSRVYEGLPGNKISLAMPETLMDRLKRWRKQLSKLFGSGYLSTDEQEGGDFVG